MSKFCIFTPTYNRRETLPRLYDSLLRQEFKDFTWLIVDDGSTDLTRELIEGYIRENLINIRYIKTENQGKSKAMNLAAQLCEDELFLCVDSDDYLRYDALSILDKTWTSLRHNPQVAGMIALHAIDEIDAKSVHMPIKDVVMPSWDLYCKYGLSRDAIHIYRSSIMKKYPNPVQNGEKFISEGYAHRAIGKKYGVYVIDEVLTFGDYRQDGLTKNARKIARENPRGYALNKKQIVEMSPTIGQKYKHTILYLVGCFFSRDVHFFKNAPDKILVILGLLPALLLKLTVFKDKSGA